MNDGYIMSTLSDLYNNNNKTIDSEKCQNQYNNRPFITCTDHMKYIVLYATIMNTILLPPSPPQKKKKKKIKKNKLVDVDQVTQKPATKTGSRDYVQHNFSAVVSWLYIKRDSVMQKCAQAYYHIRHFQFNPNTNPMLITINLSINLGVFSCWYTGVNLRQIDSKP